MYDVVIVGGGLAGLTAAIQLSTVSSKILLIEKNSYPFHKVCGEYISNEVLAYLRWLGCDPMAHGATTISKLRVSTPKGNNIRTNLDLGGFGISRYTLDHELYKLALDNGVEVWTDTRVDNIVYSDRVFDVTTTSGKQVQAKFVIGGYGKRDTLDKKLNRPFMNTHTGYMGVKYHIKLDYPGDEIGLDNFEGGYCGISKVEGNEYNLCYLAKRPAKAMPIPELEQNVLYRNPVLKQIFTEATFVWPAPKVINEISFAPKKAVEQHILMCGDTAGLITPLCGNGMSMAITAAKLLCGILIGSEVFNGDVSVGQRQHVEQLYQRTWNRHFRSRLFVGRAIQGMFGSATITEIGIRSIHALPFVERRLLSMTHGKVLVP